MRPVWWHALAVAVVCGTVGGFFHVGVVLVRRHVIGEFTWTSRDILWMSPLGNILILLAAALPLAVLLSFFPRPRLWQISVGAIGALGALGALLAIHGLHPIAAVILGLGLGVQLARLARRPRRWLAGVIIAAAAIGTAFVVTQMGRDRSPRSAISGSPPNVLVLILDTVRAASTSLHGYARETTPNLTRLADEGAMFEWAISPAPWTLPSHAAMFTGRRASSLSATWRKPLDGTFPTIAEALRDRGYATAAFVANPFYTHHESGVDRGFDRLRDFRRSRLQLIWSTTLGQTPLVNDVLWDRTPAAAIAALRRFNLRVRSEPLFDRRRSEEIIDEFLDWQATAPSRPFFAFLNLYDAHDPYEPPRNYRHRFASAPDKQDLYDAGIAYMDDQLARLFAALRDRALLDNTVLVITSDHGEQFGEHNLRNHGNSLYLPAVHVPLVMRFPARVPSGTRVRRPVSLTDLAATLADATGLPEGLFPGVSLISACCGTPVRYDALVVTETEQLDPSSKVPSPALKGPLSSVFSDSLQFIRNGDSTYQLFDVWHDPAGDRNLLAHPDNCAVGARLDALLRRESPHPATPPWTAADCVKRSAIPPNTGS